MTTARRFISLASSIALATSAWCAQATFGQQRPLPPVQSTPNNIDRQHGGVSDDDQEEAERELQTAIALTRRGQFQQAIPHFLRVQGRVSETFAVDFDLALCYLGTRQYRSAIQTLANLRGNRQQTAAVENLRAQAYIRNHQENDALKALKNAIALAPADEKLYLFISDACLDEGEYELGVQVIDAGLRNLPTSPRLFYQRGLFRLRLEELDLANQDFELARKLSPDSDIGYIAAAQQALSSGNIETAIWITREAIRKGHQHYMLLTILGEALLRSGATPATSAEFSEAQTALEKAVAKRPGYSSAQLALGKLYLLQNRLEDAIVHLELSRQFDPANPAVYAALANAYQRSGDQERARGMLAVLAQLNQQQAARIASASGGHAGVAASPALQNEAHAAPQPR